MPDGDDWHLYEGLYCLRYHSRRVHHEDLVNTRELTQQKISSEMGVNSEY